MHHLIIFGLGYTALNMLPLVEYDFTKISVVSRTNKLTGASYNFLALNSKPQLPSDATHILITIPPVADEDIIFKFYGPQIKNLKNLKWLGYLSATSVYGDHKGGWVDENSTTKTTFKTGLNRLKAEDSWLSLFNEADVPSHIFRLSGIYGANRSALDRLNDQRLINKPGHFFSRIHIDDICGILQKSMLLPTPGEIFNLSDDNPASNLEVVQFAAKISNQTIPPISPFNPTVIEGRLKEFYSDNKKIANAKVKKMLNYSFKYPSYREGLQAILKKR